MSTTMSRESSTSTTPSRQTWLPYTDGRREQISPVLVAEDKTDESTAETLLPSLSHLSWTPRS